MYEAELQSVIYAIQESAMLSGVELSDTELQLMIQEELEYYFSDRLY